MPCIFTNVVERRFEMKYLLLVSHGGFSEGLKSTLAMFAGGAMDSVLVVGLKPGESVETLGKRFDQTVAALPADSQFVVLADMIGGSPLTTVCNVLNEHDMLDHSIVLGGMNFPMALTALLSKDTIDDASELKEKILSEARAAIKEFTVKSDDSDDDDI
ncbi:phosphotransferase system mannose fructose-specific component iia [Schleiferilactobacillus perolens DSM 12744]|uniref:Phosphotransferase system mannose fructose-specific component iia n=2 Tax=Schleiferilactobacillus perolens TaxID=100468 RepID=A0A0R1N329_9LACO|nr:phosphotransferase system mannose fructose-specific component iia [Schleiferilactobacillus perolens DSM 12744]